MTNINKINIDDKYRRTWPVITQYTSQYTKKANTKYQIKTSTRQNIAFYAAAQVAARPCQTASSNHSHCIPPLYCDVYCSTEISGNNVMGP